MGKALVVDDEIDICILLKQQLQRFGFQTSYCQSIKEANNELSQTSYDLVFADLNLPDGSGYDLIDSIRAFDKVVKIVVISAYEADRQKIADLGAIYVSKPFTGKSIHATLKTLNFTNHSQSFPL